MGIVITSWRLKFLTDDNLLNIYLTLVQNGGDPEEIKALDKEIQRRNTEDYIKGQIPRFTKG